VPPGALVPLDYGRAAKTKKKLGSMRVPIWPFLAMGYSTFGRSFAYLGVPPLFIGELFLVGSMYKNRGNWLGRFVNGSMRGHLLPLSIMMCVLWGLFEVARPVLSGAPVKDALRTCAFNYYPVFLLVGIAIGREMALGQFLNFWKLFGAFYAVYSIVYAVLGQIVVAPWRGDTFLFNPPALAGMVPVGTMALWGHLRGWGVEVDHSAAEHDPAGLLVRPRRSARADRRRAGHRGDVRAPILPCDGPDDRAVRRDDDHRPRVRG
jgi:hypothetical protein